MVCGSLSGMNLTNFGLRPSAAISSRERILSLWISSGLGGQGPEALVSGMKRQHEIFDRAYTDSGLGSVRNLRISQSPLVQDSFFRNTHDAFPAWIRRAEDVACLVPLRVPRALRR